LYLWKAVVLKRMRVAPGVKEKLELFNAILSW
jgi:hypothetical protein